MRLYFFKELHCKYYRKKIEEIKFLQNMRIPVSGIEANKLSSGDSSIKTNKTQSHEVVFFKHPFTPDHKIMVTISYLNK